MTLGDTDADTTTTDGVSVLNDKLNAMGFVDITQTFDKTVFSTATAAAVRELQDTAGLSVTGTVNSATWDALFDVSATGSSLSDAYIEPLVQDPEVRQFDRTSNGSIAGLNDSYVPTRKRVDRHIDFGPSTTKAQGTVYARGQYVQAQDSKNWTGTITLNGLSGFVGEWAAGSAPTGADVMPMRDIRPGMNAWLPLFDGGTLVHISGVRVDPEGQRVTLTVDTRARDLLEVSAIIARNAEGRRNVRREWLSTNRPQRASGNMVERDELFGWLAQDVELQGDTWNIVDFPAGQSGTVNAVDIRVRNDKAQFSVAFCSRAITAKRLNRVVGNPLGTSAESVWETNNKAADWLRDKTILYAVGDGTQPAGYFPRRHRDDNGDVTDAPITGDFYDAGSPWSYEALVDHPAFIRLAIYPDRDCTLKRGQILYAQVDDVA
jgi:hypothetical protein